MKRTTVSLPREFPGGIQYAEEEALAVMGVIRARSPFRFYGPDLQSECRQFENEFGRYMASGFDKEWSANLPISGNCRQQRNSSYPSWHFAARKIGS